MKKILFVCTGNTCRSPMAEVIALKVFSDKKIDTEIRSAGICASSGGNAGANAGGTAAFYAVEAVKKYGADLSRHEARNLTAEDLQWADLIIAMTRSHKALINNFMEEGLSKKIFTIYEYAENTEKDVQDPYMGDMDVYEGCAGEIFRLVNVIADKFISDIDGE